MTWDRQGKRIFFHKRKRRKPATERGGGCKRLDIKSREGNLLPQGRECVGRGEGAVGRARFYKTNGQGMDERGGGKTVRERKGKSPFTSKEGEDSGGGVSNLFGEINREGSWAKHQKEAP